MIDKAYRFAEKAHEGQVDEEGNPYINHLTEVVRILKCVTDNPLIICAAYLHDTIEDTKVTLKELGEEFGLGVANLVYEVTHEGKKDTKGFYFPRLHSKEAIMIKFADRLSNISRMNCWNEERKAHYLKHSKFWRTE